MMEPQSLDALIIGAGFSGLYQLHALRDQLRLTAKIIEAGNGVGGTWYWNRYPGARCDSESQIYCYSFDRRLAAEWDWSERYPGHAEIRRYLNFVADRLDLKRDIHFEQRVTSAVYDANANLWRVATDTGAHYAAKYLITAVGCLSTANIPDIPGRESFRGKSYHTGLWPHEDVDFKGLRVGQIGTGSTGIQAAPVIADAAEHLTVFQRTANYSVPARNAPLTEDQKRHFKATFDDIRALTRETPNGMAYRISNTLAYDVDAGERSRRYEQAWEKGGLQFRGVFRDLIVDKRANDTAAEFIKAKIRAIVKDPETARLLSDIDHPYSCKRPPIDTNYFETFNRPNVTLVDVRSDPIAAITPDGIRLKSSQTFDLDVIVYATGFDAMTGPLQRLNITGQGGTKLNDVWRGGPRNYLGLAIPGFPNLFTITGPGSPSVLTNMPVAIEQHVEWITACIRDLESRGIARFEARPEAADEWMEKSATAANVTLLPTVAHSWYLGGNIPGKPRVFMPFAGGLNVYRDICNEVAAQGYAGFVQSR
jgi:cation diffusion facilitator CzcD-associated flavoprotein CzcO